MSIRCIFHIGFKTSDCNIERFENEEKSIKIYRCKYCDKVLLIRDLYYKSKPKLK